MSNQKPRTTEEQLSRLKNRGMEFYDEQLAQDYLSRVSYFRLKYFWIDMIDEVSDDFKENVCFEDVIDRYEFDKSLRQILFDAIRNIRSWSSNKNYFHSLLVNWYGIMVS